MCAEIRIVFWELEEQTRKKAANVSSFSTSLKIWNLAMELQMGLDHSDNKECVVLFAKLKFETTCLPESSLTWAHPFQSLFFAYPNIHFINKFNTVDILTFSIACFLINVWLSCILPYFKGKEISNFQSGKNRFECI